MELEYLGRLLAATVAGAIIGFERELSDKPAGFRTNILICLGAALFTVLSITMVGEAFSDRTRVAAQVVSGVGFLGAGAIIHFRGHVLGLTTAATIWTVASVGMAFGAGEYLIGSVATAIATVVLLGLSFLERKISEWRTQAKFHIKVAGSLANSEKLHALVRDSGIVCRAWKVTKDPEGFTIYAKLIGRKHEVERLQRKLVQLEEVVALTRL